MSLENDPALVALDVIAQTILKGINCSVEVALILKGHLDLIASALSERAQLQEQLIALGGSVSDDCAQGQTGRSTSESLATEP